MNVLGRAIAATASMVAIGVAAACVGDDPPTGSTNAGSNVGELGGSCNAGQCFGDLVCDQAINICTKGDGGTSSSGGGSSGTGSSGAGSSSGGSSGTNACAFNESPSNALPCPTVSTACDTDAGETCCLPAGPATCTNNCSAGKSVACVSKGACLPERCCLKVIGISLPAQQMCPHKVEKSELDNTRCSPACPTGEYPVCRNDLECDAPAKCRQTGLVTDTGVIQVGVCL